MTEELRDSGLLSRIYSAASSERNLHYRDMPGDRAVKGDAVRPCQENERKRISVLCGRARRYPEKESDPHGEAFE